MTEEEKMAQNIVGLNNDNLQFNMSSGEKIEDMLQREKSRKFNEQVDKYAEELKSHVDGLQQVAENMGADMSLIEIKPLFNKILIKPFAQNPFQRIVIDKKSNIVIDTGGLPPEHFDTNKGTQEKDEQNIIVGAIQEVGPDVKYLIPGDIVMYFKGSAMPVPFYKQGFWCMSETQVIAVVNESLEKRFNGIKNGGN